VSTSLPYSTRCFHASASAASVGWGAATSARASFEVSPDHFLTSSASFFGLRLLDWHGFAAPDDLEDAYAKLKEAQTKKDADEVKKWSGETSKLARALVAAPQPTDAAEADAWKQRVEYGKEVDTYTEYALSATAMQSAAEPAKTIALVEALIAQNPKSKYLDECAGSYLAALEKAGRGIEAVRGGEPARRSDAE